MARGRRGKPKSGGGGIVAGQGATTGYEAEPWRMADALRGSMDAAGHKHVVLGLVFLKIHLRRLRGDARPPRSGAGRGCRPGGSGPPHERDRVLPR